jgi:hypothetical protein
MRLLAVILLTASPHLATAAIVISDTPVALDASTEGTGNPRANYKLTVDQTPTGDYTSVWLRIEAISHTQFSLQFVNSNADDGSSWYLVDAGEGFTRAGIAQNKYPKFIDVNDTFLPRLVATVGNDFYLGVNTGVSYTESGDYRDALGWVSLKAQAFGGIPDEGIPPRRMTLEMVGNAMSYYSPGIVVGTTTVVPEPATLALSGFSVLALATLRRRK